MGNILSYVQQYGHLDFDERPFSDVDSLVLSELAYILWDGFVPRLEDNAPWVAIKIFNGAYLLDLMVVGSLQPKRNRKLLELSIKSKRFGSMFLNYYHSRLNSTEETQFSAITYRLKDNLCYIAFRGTDASILGWKEDCNMSFLSYIPGQKEAREYLLQVASHFDGSILIGGHSKGGNLSLFSATFCGPEIQKRILRVYDHDGPGFKEPIFNLPEFQAIASRINKTIPHDSFVGILLNYYDHFRVVRSLTVGVLQHDLFSWAVENGEFVYLDERAYTSRLYDRTFYTWLMTISDEDRSLFVNAFFDIIGSANIKSLHDFRHHIFRNLHIMARKTTSLDRKTKKMVFIAMKDFVLIYLRNIASSFQGEQPEKLEDDDFKD